MVFIRGSTVYMSVMIKVLKDPEFAKELKCFSELGENFFHLGSHHSTSSWREGDPAISL